LSAPNVGLRPITPQIDAGRITEPRTWLPVAIGSMQSATAAAEPDEEPPGVRVRSHGLHVGAGSAIVSSVVVVLPTSTAPPRRNASTCAASTSPMRSAKSALLTRVGSPRTSKQSLMPNGHAVEARERLPAAPALARFVGRPACGLDVELGERAYFGLAPGYLHETALEPRSR
jgi:hypothetical protein